MQRPNVLHDVLAAHSAQHRLGVGHELGLQSRIRHGVLLRAAGVVDMGFKAGSVFERDTHMGFIAAEILYRLDLYFVPQSNDCGVGCPCIAVLCQTGYAVQAGDCRAVVKAELGLQAGLRFFNAGDAHCDRVDLQRNAGNVSEVRNLTAQGNHTVNQGMQDHTAGIWFVAVGQNLPGLPQLRRHGGGLVARCKCVGKAFAPFNDFSRAVKAFASQQRCQQTVVGGFTGMKRLGHGAAVLLQAGRLRGRNAQRVIGLAAIEPEQAGACDAGRQGAQRAGEVPARVMVTGRSFADAHTGFKAQGVSHHQVLAGARHQRSRRKKR